MKIPDVLGLFEAGNYRLIIRNHWGKWFNDQFLFVIDKQYQGNLIKVYRFGIFNICLCLITSNDPEP